MQNRKKKHRAKKLDRIDLSLLVVVIFLISFGLVMIYSASYYSASLKYNDPSRFLRQQLIATGAGTVVMIFLASKDYHWLKKWSYIIYIISLVTIVLVLSPLGYEANGARRWLNLKVISFQPAELAKVSVIILMAAVLSVNIKKVKGIVQMLVVYVIAMVPAVMVMTITDNFSSAIIIMAIGAVMLIVACKNIKVFMVLMIAGFAALVALMFLGDGFRSSRIKVWMEPEKYSSSGGYQVLQGLYAIGSGGLFGKGLGQSVQKLGFVPEAQNDMIFSIICEELGIFGGLAVLLLFGFMIWRFMVIASESDDLFGSLLVVGIMAHIAVQVILNIAVVTNTMPNTGITLPFISYGGTSVMFLMGEVGIALSVSRHKKSAVWEGKK